MISVRFVPLEKWPGSSTPNRKASPFAVKYAKLLSDLERELKHLRARDVIIQAFVRPEDIRNDGWPRSSARFYGPGIILSFLNAKREQISFPCDTFKNWDCNLRAISLTLTALRSIDRYGVTKGSEQYAGWKRLGAPAQESKKDTEWAFSHLAAMAGVEPRAIRGNRVAIDLAYRSAAKRCHPDTGGNTEAFQLLQEAMNILRSVA